MASHEARRRHRGPTVRTKARYRDGIPGGMPEVEVRTVITVLTVDAALQHLFAIFREEADRGDITPTERDLLMDGAIMLAMRVDDLDRDDRAGSHLERVGRHERHTPAAAA